MPKQLQLNALVQDSREDFNQMLLEMKSKWLENHEMINSFNENLSKLKKCIAVPDHNFKKRMKQCKAKVPIFPI